MVTQPPPSAAYSNVWPLLQ